MCRVPISRSLSGHPEMTAGHLLVTPTCARYWRPAGVAQLVERHLAKVEVREFESLLPLRNNSDYGQIGTGLSLGHCLESRYLVTENLVPTNGLQLSFPGKRRAHVRVLTD